MFLNFVIHVTRMKYIFLKNYAKFYFPKLQLLHQHKFMIIH